MSLSKSSDHNDFLQSQPHLLHLTDLLEDILFPHQLLPFSVGLGEDDFKHILTRVRSTSDKINQIFQQLGYRPKGERHYWGREMFAIRQARGLPLEALGLRNRSRPSLSNFPETDN